MEGFSIRLKRLRKTKNLTQKDLAIELGLVQTTIANYEQDLRFPDEKILNCIANYFNISMDYLLGRNDNISNTDEYIKKDTTLGYAAQKYMTLILNNDINEGYMNIKQYLNNGMGIKEIYANIFEPCLKEIGKMWQNNTIDIAKEHFFSYVTENIMSRISGDIQTNNKIGNSVTLVCPGSEMHYLGLKMINDFFKIGGWNTYFLGVNVPVYNITNWVEKYNVDILCISVTMEHNMNSTISIINAIKEKRSTSNTKIIVGGYALDCNPDFWKEIGADAYSKVIYETVEIAEKLIGI